MRTDSKNATVWMVLACLRGEAATSSEQPISFYVSNSSVTITFPNIIRPEVQPSEEYLDSDRESLHYVRPSRFQVQFLCLTFLACHLTRETIQFAFSSGRRNLKSGASGAGRSEPRDGTNACIIDNEDIVSCGREATVGSLRV